MPRASAMVTANEESRDDEQLSEDEEQQEGNRGQRFSKNGFVVLRGATGGS